MFFSNGCFHTRERLVFYIKRQKSFFHDSFSRSFTLGYRGLEEVRRGLRGLNWVTTGYRGLQGLTGCYRKTFFWGVFLHKNKSGINVKFLKTMDLLLWKKANFAFFIIVLKGDFSI